MTTPAISPVDPPGACEVLNHDHDGAVTPAACELSSCTRPQTASTPMITYSPSRVVLPGLAGTGVHPRLPIDDVVNNDLAITASFGYTSAAWTEVAGAAPGSQ